MNMQPNWSRREFLRFFGGSLCASAATSISLDSFANPASTAIHSIVPTDRDALVIADGLQYRLLMAWGDVINGRGDKFGFNNDFLAWIPVQEDPDDSLLLVNHEYITNGYFLTPDDPEMKLLDDVEIERSEVGCSIVRIRKIRGEWQLVNDDAFNRRIDARTEIPIVSARPIQGRTYATGTLGNCAGGITPWKTFLTCEENYHYEVGEVDLRGGERKISMKSATGWDRFHDMPPEHYGWVVEVDPYIGHAKKHTSMGRFAHESATVVQAADGRCVVYTADDKAEECIYKFIADRPGSLDTGILYVADTDNGRWLPLDVRLNPALATMFSDQTELLIRTREAAHLAGGTKLDRPEDIEQDPVSGALYIALTKHSARPYGSILKIEEKDNDPLALEFSASTFLTGGDATGFACPDNIAFDPKGNLWFTSDISGLEQNKPPYTAFKNNGLFFVPMAGPQSGTVFQLASAPVHAEFTGPCFSQDGRHLFLAVQHPGEFSVDRDHLDSHWPDGGDALPRSGVVVISGGFLDAFSAI